MNSYWFSKVWEMENTKKTMHIFVITENYAFITIFMHLKLRFTMYKTSKIFIILKEYCLVISILCTTRCWVFFCSYIYFFCSPIYVFKNSYFIFSHFYNYEKFIYTYYNHLCFEVLLLAKILFKDNILLKDKHPLLLSFCVCS